MGTLERGKGFTLIEVLFVLGIIAILSAIILASVNSGREKSRDAKRLSDLASIQQALEVYFQEHGTFPIGPGGGNGRIGEGGLMDSYLDDYLNEIPHDPLGPGNSKYYYYYDSWHRCTTDEEPLDIVVYATLEREGSDNRLEVCDFSDVEMSPDADAHYELVSEFGVDDNGGNQGMFVWQQTGGLVCEKKNNDLSPMATPGAGCDAFGPGAIGYYETGDKGDPCPKGATQWHFDELECTQQAP